MEQNEIYYDQNTQKTSDPSPSAGKKEGGGKGLFAIGMIVIGMIVGIALTMIILGVGYLGGYLEFGWQKAMADKKEVSLGKNSFVDETLISKLQELEMYIDALYYLEPVSDEDLRTGVYRGLMDALNDPYSVYYSADELKTFMEQTEGTYYGIGAYMMQDEKTGLPRISGLIPDTPAEAGGLRANDLIYEVDGQPVADMELDQAISLIKGPEGTEVTLTVMRENASDFIKVTLKRAKVETPTVTAEMFDDDMAYIQIAEFDDVTVGQFENALNEAKNSGMKGLIIDLRGNPGGSLDAVVDICRMILPEGMIVYTEDKNGKRVEYKCDGENELKVPLVVLTDFNSASAAEIMAGAIKDHGIGTLVGTTTFGKGIVQQVIQMRDGSAIKITISAYFTPAGINIHGTGIAPDVECPFDGEAYYGSEEHPDNQLDKAKEVLRGLMGK